MLLLLLCCLLIKVIADPCNIPKQPISNLIGMKTLPDEPVIYIADSKRQNKMQQHSTRDYLLENYGDIEVILSSSNTYSHGRYTSTLEEYITTSVDTSSQYSNESFYLFGNNYNSIFKELSTLYQIPPCYYCDIAGAKTIGIGGYASGVSFHYHGSGFSEAILGTKRWFLYPPNVTKLINLFNPNMTVSNWVDIIYPIIKSQDSDIIVTDSTINPNSFFLNNNNYNNIENIINNYIYNNNNTNNILTIDQLSLYTELLNILNNNLYECTIQPGEILYFPTLWMHATLNTDNYNVFMSVFLDTQLMQ